MACSRCPRPEVIWQRASGQRLCEEHFIRVFERRAKKELREQGRLPEGKIAIALSGGKDSVAVLHFLHELTRDLPMLELVAISIDEGIQGYRESSLDICRQVTKERGIAWHLVRTKDLAGYDIDAYAAGQAGPEAQGLERAACGACGVFRRHGLNQAARELGAAVLVTGHNLDDMAQTILMNHLNGDPERLLRLAPHDAPAPGMVPRILPFRSIPEKEVLLYALLKGLPLHDEAECPYAERAHRFAMRDVLLGLEEKNPGTRHALVAGADRLKAMIPATGSADGDLPRCSRCGDVASGDLCKPCYYRQ